MLCIRIIYFTSKAWYCESTLFASIAVLFAFYIKAVITSSTGRSGYKARVARATQSSAPLQGICLIPHMKLLFWGAARSFLQDLLCPCRQSACRVACAEPKGACQALQLPEPLVRDAVPVCSQTDGLGGGCVGRQWGKGGLYHFPGHFFPENDASIDRHGFPWWAMRPKCGVWLRNAVCEGKCQTRSFSQSCGPTVSFNTHDRGCCLQGHCHVLSLPVGHHSHSFDHEMSQIRNKFSWKTEATRKSVIHFWLH